MSVPEARGSLHSADDSLRGDLRTRARWRIAERVISISIGGAALTGAVHLGLSGPLISPVSATAEGAAVAPADGAAATPDGVDNGTAESGQEVARDGDGRRGFDLRPDGRFRRDGDGRGRGR